MKRILFALSLFVSITVVFAAHCEIQIQNNEDENGYTTIEHDLPLDCDHETEITVTKRNGEIKDFHKQNSNFIHQGYMGEDFTDGSSFQFVRNEHSQIFGSLVDLGDQTVTHFSVDASGKQVAKTIPTTDFPPEDDPDDERRVLEFRPPTQLRGSEGRIFDFGSQLPSSRQLNDDDNGDFLDIMVVWTAEAECKESGLPVGCTRTQITQDNMRALVALAIEETNTAFDLSGVQTQLRLVHAQYIEYTESIVQAGVNPFKDALDALRGTTDGIMDEVHDLRDQYGADLVHMIIGATNYCGRAGVGAYCFNMFSVSSYICATGYYSFGHGKSAAFNEVSKFL